MHVAVCPVCGWAVSCSPREGLSRLAPGCSVRQAGLPGRLTQRAALHICTDLSASLEVRAGVSALVCELRTVWPPLKTHWKGPQAPPWGSFWRNRGEGNIPPTSPPSGPNHHPPGPWRWGSFGKLHPFFDADRISSTFCISFWRWGERVVYVIWETGSNLPSESNL